MQDQDFPGFVLWHGKKKTIKEVEFISEAHLDDKPCKFHKLMFATGFLSRELFFLFFYLKLNLMEIYIILAAFVE